MRLFTLFIILTIITFAKGQSNNRDVLASEDVLIAEKKLSELGFWIKNIDDTTDESTRYAVLAFQRVKGLKQTGFLISKELSILKNSKTITLKSGDFPHFEVDLKRQILFFVNENGKVSHILPVSTGTGKKFTEGGRTRRAVTLKGTFKIFKKVESWKESPLGNMYYPSYLIGGVAIHGSNFFPNRPSTYGCIKVPLIYATELSRLMPFNATVIVY